MRADNNKDARSITPWVQYRYARDWLDDARRESMVDGHGARRREISFSVCFADSYLTEWVMVDVCGRDVEQSRRFLPADDPRGVKERWQELPKEVAKAGLTRRVGRAFGGPHGEDWNQLVEFRNGLVHASASRPATDGMPREWLPRPTKSELDSLDPGWAVDVVVLRVERLHKAIDIPAPPWLRTTGTQR